MAKPWAEAGYTCYCVDLKHPPGCNREGNIVRVHADILEWWPPHGDIAFASFSPPCTDVASSGARWFKDKGLGALIRVLQKFKRCILLADCMEVPYLIENPVSTVSTYWRKPDHTFDPCDYGDPWTKKTCLWTGNGFVMPPVKRIEPVQGSRFHTMPASRDRAEIRSRTPMGFARAVFRANRRNGQ